jgi:hypothetical protein
VPDADLGPQLIRQDVRQTTGDALALAVFVLGGILFVVLGYLQRAGRISKVALLLYFGAFSIAVFATAALVTTGRLGRDFFLVVGVVVLGVGFWVLMTLTGSRDLVELISRLREPGTKE